MQHCTAVAKLIQTSGDNVTGLLGVDKHNAALLVDGIQLVLQVMQLLIVLYQVHLHAEQCKSLSSMHNPYGLGHEGS